MRIKRFIAVWGNWEGGALDYTNSQNPRLSISDCDIRFQQSFNEDLGYEEDELEKINSLEVDELWHSKYGNHYVIRIQDVELEPIASKDDAIRLYEYGTKIIVVHEMDEIPFEATCDDHIHNYTYDQLFTAKEV
jgi:hypothetical protein